MEDKLILYGNHASTCTNSVTFFLNIHNIPYEFKSINIRAGENKTEEYKKLNPFQKIPVIVDNGFVLRESTVILRYLSATRKVEENWYPQDPQRRALVDLALEYWSQNAMKFFALGLVQLGKSTLTKEQAKEIVDNAIKEMENIFLKDNKFVAGGDKPSIADLPFLFFLNGQSYYTGCNYDEHKRLNQWIEDLYQTDPRLKQHALNHEETVKKMFAAQNK